MHLFEPLETAEAADIVELPPALQDWGRECRSVLDLAVRALLQKGLVTSTDAAYKYLAAVVEEAGSHHRREILTGSSLRGSTYSSAFLELQRLIDPNTDRQGYFPRRLGSFLHDVVTKLRIGALPNYQLLHRQPIMHDAVQLPLMYTELNRQGKLFWMPVAHKDQILPNNSIRKEHLEYIRSLWIELKGYLRTKEWWSQYIQFPTTTVAELEASLTPILYPHLDILQRHRVDARNEYLYTLMLLIVASVILDVSDDTELHAFAFNLRPVPWDLGINGGFMDLVEILPPPSGDWDIRTVRTLQMVASRFRGTFVELAYQLDRIMPGTTLVINEMKFAVGDGRSHQELLNTNFDEPPMRHQRQVHRYQALSGLGMALVDDPRSSKEKVINRAIRHVPRARLEYFSPSFIPEPFDSTAKPADLEAIIEREYVHYFEVAARATTLRRTSNIVLREALRVFNDRPAARKRNDKAQDRLFKAGTPTFIGMIRDMRYADTHGIVTRTQSRGGRRRLVMDFKRLLQAIQEGEIEAPMFDPGKNGNIPCFFPEHRHEKSTSTPSLQIAIAAERPYFHCYGSCGANGSIDPKSIPKDLELFLIPGRLRRKAGNGIAAWDIPESYYACTQFAYEQMHAAFWESPAPSYLQHVRKIDPDVAYAHGAGFASLSLISTLMEWFLSQGQTPEEALGSLWKQGFVGYSHKLKASSPLDITDLLYPHGLTIDQITRPVRTPEGPKQALPYAVMNNHLVFPLGMGNDKILNFQGRLLIDGVEFRKHMKLSTGGPQGGFNLQVLADLQHANKAVYVAESILDALSLISLGYPTIAIIGTNNYFVLGHIADLGIPMGMALNNDGPGREKTVQALTWLYERQPMGSFSDWTSVFWDTLGDIRSGNPSDFNEVWKLYGAGNGIVRADLNAYTLRYCALNS